MLYFSRAEDTFAAVHPSLRAEVRILEANEQQTSKNNLVHKCSPNVPLHERTEDVANANKRLIRIRCGAHIRIRSLNIRTCHNAARSESLPTKNCNNDIYFSPERNRYSIRDNGGRWVRVYIFVATRTLDRRLKRRFALQTRENMNSRAPQRLLASRRLENPGEYAAARLVSLQRRQFRSGANEFYSVTTLGRRGRTHNFPRIRYCPRQLNSDEPAAKREFIFRRGDCSN